MSIKAGPNAIVAPQIMPPWNHTTEEILSNFKAGLTPRDQQVYAIGKINDAFKAGKRIIAADMPTGTGKTFVAAAFADALKNDGGAYLITSQTALQEQYQADYPAPHLELLKGRSHYACNHPMADEGMDAAHGVCKAKNKGILRDCVDESFDEPGIGTLLQRAVSLSLPPCAQKCPYWSQLQKANDSKFTLFNFSSFLFQRRIGRFQKRALLIIDEVHGAENQLMNYVSVDLTESTLSIINVRIRQNISSKAEFVEWLRQEDVARKIDRALQDCEEGSEDTPEDLTKEESDALKELQGKIANFLKYLDQTEWILETVDYETRRWGPTRKIVARPLYVKAFAQDLLFRHADRVIGMSATILDHRIWAENLGLNLDEIEYVQTPCDFPVENRPVFLEFAGNLSRKYFSPEMNPKNPTKPKFVAKIKQLLARHEGQRGLIHCHSFEFSNVLRNEVASPRFLFQDQFDGNKQAMMAAHAGKSDSVIVAPAMAEGFDFKDKLCRFQILAKVPWPSLGDKVIKERAARDDKFYAWLTAIKLCQSLGRGVRHSKDYCFSYIVDQGMEFFLAKNGSMIPRWVKDAFKKYPPKPQELRRD
jgi:Rad3-related DNA helicase